MEGRGRLAVACGVSPVVGPTTQKFGSSKKTCSRSFRCTRLRIYVMCRASGSACAGSHASHATAARATPVLSSPCPHYPLLASPTVTMLRERYPTGCTRVVTEAGSPEEELISALINAGAAPSRAAEEEEEEVRAAAAAAPAG